MHREPRLFEILPFVLTLLSLAILPSVAHDLWEKRSFRSVWAFLLAAPALTLALGRGAGAEVSHAAHDYLDFVILLGALYVIAGGVRVQGRLEGTPGVNTLLLLAGAAGASLLGTAGASMLLIRPFLHANRRRRRITHGVIFLIILVGNVGGLLLPIGDPPLYLGFLRGVPFFWTLGLWLLLVSVLCAMFFLLDRRLFRKEGFLREEDSHSLERLRISGLGNVPVLVAAIAAAALLRGFWRPAALAACAGISWGLTRGKSRRDPGFSLAPVEEIVFVFFAIFATIVPAIELLEHHAKATTLSSPLQFFWLTGIFSSLLDNAPAYLTFFSAAQGLGGGTIAGVREELLRAISLASVFFGALTYVGNGPNFMVRAVAKDTGIEMPGFFGYLGIASLILIPLLILVSVLFL